MGTGPYAYQSMETRRELHLTRYDGYFGQAPAFNEVTVYFVSNEETISQCLGSDAYQFNENGRVFLGHVCQCQKCYAAPL